jgi:hypothetical protein
MLSLFFISRITTDGSPVMDGKKINHKGHEVHKVGNPACTPYLCQSGMITQQQLRTSPAAAKMTSLTILFLEFHKSERRLPIPALSVGCDA